MSLPILITTVVLLASFGVPRMVQAGSETYACRTDGISVTAASPDEADQACDAAARADAQLRGLGLHAPAAVLIEVTDTLDVAEDACVALYSPHEKRMQVLAVECLGDSAARASTFPRMDAEVLFESLIVHELVHAYLDQDERGYLLPRIAHEYLAYAIQMDSLPKEDRNRALSRAAVAEPVELQAINDALLNMAPVTFAAMAWTHFHRQGGDAALVERIISGQIVLNTLWE